MKAINFFLFFTFLLVCGIAVSAQNWISDTEMQFKIQAPQTYSQNQMRDGTDKILTLLSPDENVMVRIRAMKATNQFTTELLQKAFEQNMIKGAQRIMNENGALQGIPALTSAYTWKVDGSDAVLGIYYIVQQGFAYVVWTAVPRDLLQQRSAEADRITNSFTLLQLQGTNTFAGSQTHSVNTNQVALLNANLGNQVDQDFRVTQPTTGFNKNISQINLSFSYSGHTFATPFILKWYSRSHNQTINEYTLNTPNENSGHGYGFISNHGNTWPQGNYYVEIWHDGKKLMTRDFQIQ
jgi:hypothetical protein